VLFYGAKNIRRDFTIKLLSDLFQVRWLGDIYGAERDEEISKSRLVLNIHFYLAQTLELVRISHLLQNGVAVITEESDLNPYGDGVAMTKYRHIPKAVMGHLQNPSRMDDLRRKGPEALKKYPMKEIVKTALSEGKLETFTPLDSASPQSAPSDQVHPRDQQDTVATEGP
jgi:hypothetical protein